MCYLRHSPSKLCSQLWVKHIPQKGRRLMFICSSIGPCCIFTVPFVKLHWHGKGPIWALFCQLKLRKLIYQPGIDICYVYCSFFLYLAFIAFLALLALIACQFALKVSGKIMSYLPNSSCPEVAYRVLCTAALIAYCTLSNLSDQGSSWTKL